MPPNAAAPLLWITPSPAGQAAPPPAELARELAGQAVITKLSLAVWDLPPDQSYDLAVEVNAVRAAMRAHGRPGCHLFGFSAGGTVALAAALALGDAVLSLTVLEPATIGDDDWHPIETTWHAKLAAIRALPAAQRGAAFRELMLRPGEAPPPLGPAPLWDTRTDRLEDMLAQAGFVSGDLAAITRPVLAISGGRSHPRFHQLSERMAEVIPHAEAQVFGERSHLSPPHRREPARLAAVLRDFWARSPQPRR